MASIKQCFSTHSGCHGWSNKAKTCLINTHACCGVVTNFCVDFFVTMPAENILLLRMKNSSGANHPSGSVPRTPTTPTVPNAMMSFRKFALAEFRYGKEDILALYADNLTLSSNILQSVSLITSEIVKPLAFLPFSDEEQVSL